MVQGRHGLTPSLSPQLCQLLNCAAGQMTSPVNEGRIFDLPPSPSRPMSTVQEVITPTPSVPPASSHLISRMTTGSVGSSVTHTHGAVLSWRRTWDDCDETGGMEGVRLHEINDPGIPHAQTAISRVAWVKVSSVLDHASSSRPPTSTESNPPAARTRQRVQRTFLPRTEQLFPNKTQ